VLGLRICPLLMVVAALGAPAAAQTADSTAGIVAPARMATITPSITPGELVRVWVPRARVEGATASFVRIDSNLVVAGEARSPELPGREAAFPVDAVTRLQVWRGTPRSKTRIFFGVVIGGAAGAGVGALLTSFIECGGACDDTGPQAAKESPKLGAMIGAPIGAILGGVVAGMKHPRWRQVTLSIR
jgi:hypothetical protein